VRVYVCVLRQASRNEYTSQQTAHTRQEKEKKNTGGEKPLPI
jgi:hypothetical protein